MDEDLVKVSSGVQEESMDMSKWEMETEPLIDRQFHNLIGYSEDSNGVWTRDEFKSQIMNELGASEFVQELRAVFSPNMQMSDLDDDFILEVASTIGDNFSDKLSENYDLWGVRVSPANLRSICDQLVNQVRIFLRIARKGGMRRHRERRGIKTFMNPAMQGGAY